MKELVLKLNMKFLYFTFLTNDRPERSYVK